MLKDLLSYFESTRVAIGDCAGALIVSRSGKVLLEKYVHGKYAGEISPATLWPVFSATKGVTSGLLLSLVEDGTLGLDDPVSKHLAAFSTHGPGEYDRRDVTIRHLASFTAGTYIPREKYTPKPTPPDLELVQVDKEPGTDFDYALLQMYLLEVLLETATGQDYDSLLQTRILGPLGLRDSRFVYKVPTDLPILPGRKNESDDPARSYYLSSKGIRTSTGLFMSARDLHSYTEFWLSGGERDGYRHFSKSLIDEAWSVHGHPEDRESKYGLLWWLHTDTKGYVISGWGGKVSIIVPNAEVVITAIRNPPSYPEHGPYSYYADQAELIQFAQRLSK